MLLFGRGFFFFFLSLGTACVFITQDTVRHPRCLFCSENLFVNRIFHDPRRREPRFDYVHEYSTLPGTVHVLAFPSPFSILVLHKPNQLALLYSFCSGLAYFFTSCYGQIQLAVQTFLPKCHTVVRGLVY